MWHGRLALGLLLASVVLAVPVLVMAPGSVGTDLLAQLDGLLVTSTVVALAFWAFDVVRGRRRSPRPSVPYGRGRPGRSVTRAARPGPAVRRPVAVRPAARPARLGRDLAQVPVSHERQG